jgi:hypothetical protein
VTTTVSEKDGQPLWAVGRQLRSALVSHCQPALDTVQNPPDESATFPLLSRLLVWQHTALANLAKFKSGIIISSMRHSS